MFGRWPVSESVRAACIVRVAMAPMGDIYFHPDGGGWSDSWFCDPKYDALEKQQKQEVDDAKRSAMAQVREIEQHAREEGEERARKILTIAIQRVASEQTAASGPEASPMNEKRP